VLKPSGCLAFLGYTLSKINPVEVDATNLPENIAEISKNLYTDLMMLGLPEDVEVKKSILEALSRYENIFKAIPFKIKERHDDIHQEFLYSFDDMQNIVRSISMFETFRRTKTEELQSKGQDISEEDVDLSLLIVNKLRDLWKLQNFPNDKKVAQFDLHHFLLLAKI